MEWLYGFWESLTWGRVLIAAGLFLVSLAITFAAIAGVLIKVPSDYFSSHYQRDFLPGSPWAVRWGAVVLKNMVGVFLVLLGLALSLPGIPGQGFADYTSRVDNDRYPGQKAVRGEDNKTAGRFRGGEQASCTIQKRTVDAGLKMGLLSFIQRKKATHTPAGGTASRDRPHY